MIRQPTIFKTSRPHTARTVRLWPVAVSLAAVAAVVLVVTDQAPAAEPVESERCTAPPSPAGGQYWHHPVDAPIVDGFRPPAGPYGPGNRGLEYGTSAGDPVSAAAAGVVSFAGPVGRSRFVVVQHPFGLRSTYAYLNAIRTTVGDTVAQGQPIAAADQGFHLTARRGDTYIDPLLLLIDGCSFVKLVPIPPGDRLTTVSG